MFSAFSLKEGRWNTVSLVNVHGLLNIAIFSKLSLRIGSFGVIARGVSIVELNDRLVSDKVIHDFCKPLYNTVCFLYIL